MVYLECGGKDGMQSVTEGCKDQYARYERPYLRIGYIQKDLYEHQTLRER
jgi:hypothetical protein